MLRMCCVGFLCSICFGRFATAQEGVVGAEEFKAALKGFVQKGQHVQFVTYAEAIYLKRPRWIPALTTKAFIATDYLGHTAEGLRLYRLVQNELPDLENKDIGTFRNNLDLHLSFIDMFAADHGALLTPNEDDNMIHPEVISADNPLVALIDLSPDITLPEHADRAQEFRADMIDLWRRKKYREFKEKADAEYTRNPQWIPARIAQTFCVMVLDGRGYDAQESLRALKRDIPEECKRLPEFSSRLDGSIGEARLFGTVDRRQGLDALIASGILNAYGTDSEVLRLLAVAPDITLPSDIRDNLPSTSTTSTTTTSSPSQVTTTISSSLLPEPPSKGDSSKSWAWRERGAILMILAGGILTALVVLRLVRRK